MSEQWFHHKHHTFTFKILIGMALGIIVGLVIKWLPLSESMRHLLAIDILKTGGDIFINIIKMLVVPIVLVSLICGSSALGDIRKLGRIGGKAVGLYIVTTVIAISLAILLATLFHVGEGANLALPAKALTHPAISVRRVIVNIFPSNPFQAMATGNMLQIIIFAILFGVAMTLAGGAGESIANLFKNMNEILMKLITMIMRTAPYGVFCLLGALFARVGFELIMHLLEYFWVVFLVLVLQLLGVYTLFLKVIGRLSPWGFLRKMRDAMLFAFSVSSSNASIPIVLKTVEFKLGVKNSIASFIVPLGSTINMDGTAIMQGVATVFIAHAYNVPIGLSGYITVVTMATLASIGTAGVPSVGLITLAMVLQQVGLPVQGIALIIGVDRLLDMARTAVNIAGDSMIACLVGKSENALDLEIYNRHHEKTEAME